MSQTENYDALREWCEKNAGAPFYHQLSGLYEVSVKCPNCPQRISAKGRTA